MQGEIRQNSTKFDENRGDTMTEDDGKGEVRFTVSAQLFGYLKWLSKNTVLGKAENDVAKQVLTQALTTMRREDYRDKSSVDND